MCDFSLTMRSIQFLIYQCKIERFVFIWLHSMVHYSLVRNFTVQICCYDVKSASNTCKSLGFAFLPVYIDTFCLGNFFENIWMVANE